MLTILAFAAILPAFELVTSCIGGLLERTHGWKPRLPRVEITTDRLLALLVAVAVLIPVLALGKHGVLMVLVVVGVLAVAWAALEGMVWCARVAAWLRLPRTAPVAPAGRSLPRVSPARAAVMAAAAVVLLVLSFLPTPVSGPDVAAASRPTLVSRTDGVRPTMDARPSLVAMGWREERAITLS